jgi:16S rRNA processing protein RimM
VPTDEPHPDAVAGERVTVGHVNSPWGLAGHVKVTPHTSNPERFAVGTELLVDGVLRRVEAMITPRGYPVVRFSGIPGRERAETLRGAAIEIETEELPAPPEGAHYVHDVLGLAVVTTAGESIGELVDVLATGANDVYVVRREGQRDALIPATAEVVREVDIEGRRLVIEPLAGLLDS